MQIFIKIEIPQNMLKEDEVLRAQDEFGKQFKHIVSSGKMVMGGAFADTDGGFFIVDVEDTDDLADLFIPSLFTNVLTETHFIVPLGGNMGRVGN
ncbi:hypothetical protein C4577_07080 [Candidatus Parcubacteria bacterium]|nr:MAG: hypothetical protein C4577_07080 [Candidatus Parcubacteria bacterium]